MESTRPADEDRAGGRNTMTRRATGDLATPRHGVHTMNGRKMLASNADALIHLLADDAQHSLCGYAYTQMRLASERELIHRHFCQNCVAKS